MLKIVTLITVCGIFFSTVKVSGQTIERQKRISIKQDTVQIDTLSIVPGSITVKNLSGEILLPLYYQIVYDKALLVWKTKPAVAEVEISYKTLPILLSRRYFNKDPKLIGETTVDNTPYIYNTKNGENTLFSFSGLNKSGSISRSVGFGNTQGLSVNSNMVLQLSGKIAGDVDILAAISDDNIPIQPGGNTQQINDFDKVFIQLSRRNTSVVAGDYELRRPDSYFMNFFKRAQGGSFSTAYQTENGWRYKSNLSVAVAKGRSARNIVQGIEGNQGPYRLTGNNVEQFIIVLSGTERIYLDGELLRRGQENDYVIDYNTSELSFTPKRLITQNSRIIIEFEYSDKNYARALTYANQEISKAKMLFKINLYNEQDNPNRPFLQLLSPNQKQFLQDIGNQTNQAFFSNADSVPFNSNEILYKKLDTLGAKGVYVYSSNPQLAKYRLGFSFVGQGQGNYKLSTTSAANGRVFEFAALVAGSKQGSYEPITLLITPKKQQLITFGTDYKFNKTTFLSSELALSNNDVNLFSAIGNSANAGMALKLMAGNEHKFNRDSLGLKIISNASLELTSIGFKPIERYRPVEFERDFNLAGITDPSPERLGKASISLFKDVSRQIGYQLAAFTRLAQYSGVQHSVNANYHLANYRFAYNGNLLNSSSVLNNGKFFRQSAILSRGIKNLELGLSLEQEKNSTVDLKTQLLALYSFFFNQYKLQLASNSSMPNKFMIEYGRRYDKLPVGYTLIASSVADIINAGLQLNKNPNSILSISSTYRLVNYNNRLAYQDESTLLGRTEYSLNLWKGFLNSSTFYELGTGQEPKREFTYLEVQAGQGAYAWNDYNKNGIKELNEFETARYQDQAVFIRIFQPTNQFVKTNYTTIDQTLRLSPALLFGTSSPSFIAKISNQTELKTDRKIFDKAGLNILNPFHTQIDEANLVSLNSYFRNTLFFNRNSPMFGLDLNYQQNSSKILLTNGFDSRSRSTTGIRMRYNLVKKSNLIIQANTGTKLYQSGLFKQQNYSIHFIEFLPQFDYLVNTGFRLTFSGGYINQQNGVAVGGEKSANLRLSTEARYNILKKGAITSRINILRNNYIGGLNSPVSYEMLEGLQPGNNLVWDLGLQRGVANGIQLNINYQGRKSPGVNAVHTGGVQVRAFF